MPEIIFVTTNEGKIREAQLILGDEWLVKPVNLELDEIQAIDAKAIVDHKVKQAWHKLYKLEPEHLNQKQSPEPIFIEDQGFYIAAWNALPGALIKWFLESVGCSGICQMMADQTDRRIWVESAIAYYDGKKVEIVTGKIKGTIAAQPRGEFGFGWDSIFIPEGYSQTFAEMGIEEKSKISMRRLALESLSSYLRKIVN